MWLKCIISRVPVKQNVPGKETEITIVFAVTIITNIPPKNELNLNKYEFLLRVPIPIPTLLPFCVQKIKENKEESHWFKTSRTAKQQSTTVLSCMTGIRIKAEKDFWEKEDNKRNRSADKTFLSIEAKEEKKKTA